MRISTVYAHFHMQEIEGSHQGKETYNPSALRITKSILVSLKMKGRE